MTARCPRAATSSRIRRPTSRSTPRAPIWSTTIPKPAVENIKKNLKIYPYPPGGFGTSIAQALEGTVRIARRARRSPRRSSSRAAALSFNTIPPSDFGFFEMINENVQSRARHQLRRGARRPARRHRHRQGQAVRARRADEEDPDRRRRRRPGDRPGAELALRDAAPGLGLLRGLDVGQHAVGGRRLLRDAAAALRGRHVQAAAADRRPHARFAHGLLLRLHARLARHDHAHPGRRLAVPDGLPRRRRRTRSTAPRPTR